MHESIEIQLDCGIAVFVRGLNIQPTFRGFLEGDRRTTSQIIRYRLAKQFANSGVGESPILVAPLGQSFNPEACIICGAKDSVQCSDFVIFDDEQVWMDFNLCDKHSGGHSTLEKIQDSLVATGASEPLPQWTCIGSFQTFGDGGSYELEVHWFADSVDKELRELIHAGVRSIDWRQHARFISFEDY